MNRFLHNILSKTAIAAIALAMLIPVSSCSMMEDDTDDCPKGLYVRFVYDYNTQRADMFRDHVGHVKLYVYDENGHKVAERSVSNSGSSAPLRSYGYAIHFDPSELAPGRYRLQAVAMQKDWDDALDTPGAKYRRTEGDGHTDLKINLDCSRTPVTGTQRYPVAANAPMDTLWHTLKVMSYEPTDGRGVPDLHQTKAPYSVYPLEDQFVTVTDNKATYATVSMIRDTKHLDLTLRQIDDPDNMFDWDYSVEIAEPNAKLDHDNALLPSDSLSYTPYAAWTTRLTDGGISVEPRPDSKSRAVAYQRTAHYNVMFNRLMFDRDDPDKGAVLRITRKDTGKTVALINLTQILAQGRTAFELYNYPEQEYLDREYDYHLDFLLKGDSWAYCDIVINVLSWSKRIQNESL